MMADFLEQYEIDCLLNNVDDEDFDVDEEVTEKVELGVQVWKGTSKEELQSVEIGKEGYFSVKPKTRYFGTSRETLFKGKVVEIRDQSVLLVDSKFQPHVANIDELSNGFYKDYKRYEALGIKDVFGEIDKTLNNANMDLPGFIKALKQSKQDYPEIWIGDKKK